MKVYYSDAFIPSYCSDPAASLGRMESIVRALRGNVSFLDVIPADIEDIAACHTDRHIAQVRSQGLYDIASLAAGGAIQAAFTGLEEPSFALVRPPGHHASADSSWGFCYFNNIAIAISKLREQKKIGKAFILDFDLHFGDGTMNILGNSGYVDILNPSDADPARYLLELEEAMPDDADMIAVSAGFDNHREDWGGLLSTDDYRELGRIVRRASERSGGGCFGVLEGGYNHGVLGQSVMAFLEGMRGD
ncbi:MAG: histone deacetylase family protein [Syntrophales bacterium]|jgi:acetoin utilization deacetylase AcuC-like enzyme|nr:histone deacetylase family protein [Syntrophales bacterium]MCK9528374.1 histone deacetylase family protein [Syntrophales bacterium]MDX9922701.1 histone deacetylase family protein [Syntrophales bacterium]